MMEEWYLKLDSDVTIQYYKRNQKAALCGLFVKLNRTLWKFSLKKFKPFRGNFAAIEWKVLNSIRIWLFLIIVLIVGRNVRFWEFFVILLEIYLKSNRKNSKIELKKTLTKVRWQNG